MRRKWTSFAYQSKVECVFAFALLAPFLYQRPRPPSHIPHNITPRLRVRAIHLTLFPTIIYNRQVPLFSQKFAIMNHCHVDPLIQDIMPVLPFPRCLLALALGSFQGFILTSFSHGPLRFVHLFLTLTRLPHLFLAKHFLNDPSSLVIESLQGLCTINPKLGLDANNKGSSLGRVLFQCLS